MTEIELEMIWSLHASIFYIDVRQYIYRLPLTVSVEETVAAEIRMFLE